jgi:hypothetical protein
MVDASNNFTNWHDADLAINGIDAASFGLFEYNVPVTLAAKGTDTFGFQNLPTGTFVIAFGTDLSTQKLYATPFTEAGLTTGQTPPPVGVPAPSGLVLGLFGLFSAGGFGLWRRLRGSPAL